MDSPKITALILAAGASTRMGEPKQLLPWKSTTLLNHCINEVMQSNIHQTLVVLGANKEKIKPSIAPSDMECLINPDWKTGMGSSIALAVHHLRKKDVDGLMIVLADQPFVDTNFLNKLITQFTPDTKQIVTTNYNDKGGVPAIFDRYYFDELSSLSEKQGAKQLIQKFTENASKVTPDFDHHDVDTPEEYQVLYLQIN